MLVTLFHAPHKEADGDNWFLDINMMTISNIC
uniref:Uncharacterized protein n=1 Tax=Rhizophora mucronata TaxID=61149 RepID=A0A2P2N7L9_RHIMU